MKDKFNPAFPRMAASNMSATTRKWMLKLICLILAFAVWQGIRESTSYEVVVADIPVVIAAGNGLAVQDQSTDVVSIRFRGSRDDVRFISRDQVSMQMNISDSTRLRQTLKFSHRYVKAPSRAHAVEFYPPEVSVTVDREVERALPVKASFEGSLPEGIQLENAVCEPAMVRLRGAEQTLLNLDQVRTVPISLKERYTSFKTFVEVAAAGQAWAALPTRVSVSVSLMEHVDTRRIEGNPVHPLTVSDDMRGIHVVPERVAVILRGSPAALENLKTSDLTVYVDCSGLTEPTEYELPVRVDVPAGVYVEATEPSVVQVTVQTL